MPQKSNTKYPHDPQEAFCPHCGEKQRPCSYVNSLARGWARQACKYKHSKKNEKTGND